MSTAPEIQVAAAPTKPSLGPSTAAMDVLQAFLEVREIDIRHKLALLDQVEGLLRLRWTSTELCRSAAEFAGLNVDVGRFYWWAKAHRASST